MRLLSSVLLLGASLACAGVPSPSPPAAPPAASVQPKEEAVLHEITAGRITARWHGEAVEGVPKTYGVERLEFVIEGQILPFSPTGTLNFSDWSFAIFSPDESWVVLQQDRYGPFHAIRAKNLAAYLRGNSAPDQILAYEGGGDFRPVFEKPSWAAPHTFSYVEASETPVPKTVELPN